MTSPAGDNGYETAWNEPSELTETIIARFEMALFTVADPFTRAGITYAVHVLLTDPELAEELDRMRTPGRAA